MKETALEKNTAHEFYCLLRNTDNLFASDTDEAIGAPFHFISFTTTRYVHPDLEHDAPDTDRRVTGFEAWVQFPLTSQSPVEYPRAQRFRITCNGNVIAVADLKLKMTETYHGTNPKKVLAKIIYYLLHRDGVKFFPELLVRVTLGLPEYEH